MATIVQPGAAGIAAPAGIQFIPGPSLTAAGDKCLVVPVFKDTTGKPDRMVVVGVLATNSVSVITYTLLDNSWVFDDTVDARDDGVTLNVTAADITDISAFAIESPGTSTDPILFIGTNDVSQTPDTMEMDSIQLTDGATSLTATAVTITGANQPTDTNGMITISIPLTADTVMTFFEDDVHFATITGNQAGFTFTYAAAKVSAVDTSIVPTQTYSGLTIGTQVVLFTSLGTGTSSFLWEMSTAAVLVEEFNPFITMGMGTDQDAVHNYYSTIIPINGVFAVASPYGGGDAAGDDSAYLAASFPLDSI